ncbi:unnamed protein product [Diplocarpon coronariae]|nr:hypothetical protein JHW43_008903 [Diplocarpon mali]
MPIDSFTDVDFATDNSAVAQSSLVCHSGLPASVCASQYSASCDGGFFSHSAQNGLDTSIRVPDKAINSVTEYDGVIRGRSWRRAERGLRGDCSELRHGE